MSLWRHCQTLYRWRTAGWLKPPRSPLWFPQPPWRRGRSGSAIWRSASGTCWQRRADSPPQSTQLPGFQTRRRISACAARRPSSPHSHEGTTAASAALLSAQTAPGRGSWCPGCPPSPWGFATCATGSCWQKRRRRRRQIAGSRSRSALPCQAMNPPVVMTATSLMMTKLTSGQQTLSFIPQKYPGHLSIADLLGNQWHLGIGKPTFGLQCTSFLMFSLEAVPRKVDLSPCVWCLCGEQRWDYPSENAFRTTWVQRATAQWRAQTGQRPADQAWPNEFNLWCLSLPICKYRAILTSLLKRFEIGREKSKKSSS